MKAPRVGVQALGLAALVLTIFYPALHAPLNPVDDRAIVEWLYNVDGSGTWEILTRTTDYFYRPVLLATFLLDMKLWGAETSFMHLVNVLLHVANVLLLFACARNVCGRLFPGAGWLPLLAALLFAIHPVNTEAVNWIAGRSDLLACFFVLLAALLLLRGLATNRPLYAYLSMLPLAPGFFAKETAVFFIPAALVIIVCDDGPPATASPGLIAQIRARLPFLVPYFALPLLYLAVRGGFLLSRDTGFKLVRQVVADRHLDLAASLQTAAAGFGFYARKLVFPFPLNFTIAHVPGYSFWIGLLVIALLAYCAWRRNLVGGLFLASACLGTSAILVMLLRPAWTPVAERYLYLPSAFFCLAVVLAGYQLVSRFQYPRAIPLVLLFFFSATAYATLERNLLWQDNVRLFEDAVRKSPGFPFVRSVLADLLRQSGREAEGKAMIQANTAPEGLRNADFLDLKRAELLFQEGHCEESRALIMEKRRREGQLYYNFQRLLVKVDLQLVQSRVGRERQEIADELIALYKELIEVTQDPFYHYRLGQFHLQESDRTSAVRHFRLAAQQAPDGASYKQAAARLAEKLSMP